MELEEISQNLYNDYMYQINNDNDYNRVIFNKIILFINLVLNPPI